MFLHGRGKSQTILLRKSNFQWFLFFIVIRSAFVCQDFRTHINVQYFFEIIWLSTILYFLLYFNEGKKAYIWVKEHKILTFLQLHRKDKISFNFYLKTQEPCFWLVSRLLLAETAESNFNHQPQLNKWVIVDSIKYQLSITN